MKPGRLMDYKALLIVNDKAGNMATTNWNFTLDTVSSCHSTLILETEIVPDNQQVDIILQTNIILS